MMVRIGLAPWSVNHYDGEVASNIRARSTGAAANRAQWVTVLGERLCLDLVNSANWKGNTVVDEAFATPIDVVDWAERARILPRAAARRWRARFRRDPDSAGTLVADVRACRQALRLLFDAAMRNREPPVHARTAINACLRGGKPGRLVTSGARLGYEPIGNAFGPWLLHRAATSAVELIVSTDRAALECCPGVRCGWLFLDRTRGRTRRWCQMETCGNRAKARRHYQRERQPPGRIAR